MGKQIRLFGFIAALLLINLLPAREAKAGFGVGEIRNPTVLLDHLAKNSAALLTEVGFLLQEEPTLIQYGLPMVYRSYRPALLGPASNWNVGFRPTNFAQQEQIMNARKRAILAPFERMSEESTSLYGLGYRSLVTAGPALPGNVIVRFQRAFIAADYQAFRNMMASYWLLTNGIHRIYYETGPYRSAVINAQTAMRLRAINHYTQNVYNLMLAVRSLPIFALNTYYGQLGSCYFATYPFRPYYPGEVAPIPYPAYNPVQGSIYGTQQFYARTDVTPQAAVQNPDINYSFDNWQYNYNENNGANNDAFSQESIQPPAGLQSQGQQPQYEGQGQPQFQGQGQPQFQGQGQPQFQGQGQPQFQGQGQPQFQGQGQPQFQGQGQPQFQGQGQPQFQGQGQPQFQRQGQPQIGQQGQTQQQSPSQNSLPPIPSGVTN